MTCSIFAWSHRRSNPWPWLGCQSRHKPLTYHRWSVSTTQHYHTWFLSGIWLPWRYEPWPRNWTPILLSTDPKNPSVSDLSSELSEGRKSWLCVSWGHTPGLPHARPRWSHDYRNCHSLPCDHLTGRRWLWCPIGGLSSHVKICVEIETTLSTSSQDYHPQTLVSCSGRGTMLSPSQYDLTRSRNHVHRCWSLGWTYHVSQ